MDLEQLFKQYPGLQNLYENALQQGYTGTPQDLLQQYGQDFQQNVGGLGSMMGIQRAPQTPRVTPEMAQQIARQQTGAQLTQAEASRMIDQYMPQMPVAQPMQQAMPAQQMPQATPMQPAVDPAMLAYQRGLLSGSMPAATPYGYGMATSPYYGYPRSPYGGLLY